MNRIALDSEPPGDLSARADMTILEAADWMERHHGSRMMVREPNGFVGILTEQDIVEKVLAAGGRPDLVRVADVMHRGRRALDGSLLLEDDEPVDDEATEAGPPSLMLQGKCEECGVFSVDLVDTDGLLICPDCVAPARLWLP